MWGLCGLEAYVLVVPIANSDFILFDFTSLLIAILRCFLMKLESNQNRANMSRFLVKTGYGILDAGN